MIEFSGVTVRYPGADRPVLERCDLTVPEGELCLVIGRTGSGKSTLLRCVNGLVPHFTGGTLSGRVTVAGRDTRTHPPRELADVVGVVGQDPLSGFVSDTVEEELAYGMECLGVPAQAMRQRTEEVLDLLGLAPLRGRALADLSAGEQQRVAIGAVLTSTPRVLVLDEPTSALDPPAAEEVLAALTRLVHDLGLTVLVAEHRLERVVQYADRVIHLPGGGERPQVGRPAEVLAAAPVAPPVVRLGRLAGWSPPPLSVRDARRRAGELRARLAAATAAAATPAAATPPSAAIPPGAPPLARTNALVVSYGAVFALRGVDVALHRGQVVALMGRNGAGKSSLLRCLVGLRRPDGGRVDVDGIRPADRPAAEVVRRVGLVPATAADLLYADSVADECADADREAHRPPGTTAALLEGIEPAIPPDRHPRDLSEGQRLALALAVVLAAAPPLLLLDEPTRGLDYPAKARLVGVLRRLAAAGHAVLLATHDVELVAELADRVLLLADGELVADGPTREVITGSPAFAPQVAKVLAPQRWLTVDDVERALAG
jgi:energy-coupling factor transporter ATP-binding protein EcfA2